MPPPSKRKKQSGAAAATSTRQRLSDEASTHSKQRRKAEWDAMAESLVGKVPLLRNLKGRIRPMEENKIVMLVLLDQLQLMMAEAINDGDEYCTNLSENKLFDRTSKVLRMDNKEVRRLYEAFTDPKTGGTLDSLEPVKSNADRGKGSANAKPHGKIPKPVQLHLINYIDKKHEKGKNVSRRELRNFLRKKHAINISKSALSRTMISLGLGYKPSKPKARNNNIARVDQIRDYLIELHRLLKDEEEGKVILIYTDESYCNTNHCATHSWHLNTGNASRNKSTSKGRRLIFLHAITKYGPLCDIDPATDKPVDEIKWTGNTPHVKSPTAEEIAAAGDTPPLLTAELIWLSDSHTGDYHDNMNGAMFMKWVSNKCLPIAKKHFPTRKPVLVMDNAPYHHVRGIESLAKHTKQQMIDLMKDHGMDYALIPLTDERKGLLPNQHNYTIEGDKIRIPFNEDQFKARKTKTNALYTPAAEELKVSAVLWLKRHKPNLLRCKVEKAIEDAGGRVLWTPPYCPDLQPIELFWAAGKGNVARNYYFGRNVKATVADLRDGWYGNKVRAADGTWTLQTPEDEDDVDMIEEVKASDCGGLVSYQTSHTLRRWTRNYPLKRHWVCLRAIPSALLSTNSTEEASFNASNAHVNHQHHYAPPPE